MTKFIGMLASPKPDTHFVLMTEEKPVCGIVPEEDTRVAMDFNQITCKGCQNWLNAEWEKRGKLTVKRNPDEIKSQM